MICCERTRNLDTWIGAEHDKLENLFRGNGNLSTYRQNCEPVLRSFEVKVSFQTLAPNWPRENKSIQGAADCHYRSKAPKYAVQEGMFALITVWFRDHGIVRDHLTPGKLRVNPPSTIIVCAVR
jgi:hypothetical protein